MKKIAFLLLFACTAVSFDAPAQNIALGERVPELKPSAWLEGKQPAATELTYVEFYQSSNKACKTSLDKLKALTEKFGKRLRVVVVTNEKGEVVTPQLSSYLSPVIGVAFDPAGKAFAAYGVTYLPFGVLTDAKNRALWLGNSLQLTEEVIEKSK